MFWDFLSLRPETTHQVSFLFSDRGIPDGYRHMNGYGSHTFKVINAENQPVYCKFHYKTNQGIKNLPVDEADQLAGNAPDYGIRDLYCSIAEGKFPSWSLYIQVMTFDQAERFSFNPFDLTKIWPQKEYPLIPVGQIVLNRNPTNYFAEVEQIAFCPVHMVPGIEPSPDKMLQGRLFSYDDTHNHRIGPNFKQLPVNRSIFKVANYHRDGPMCADGNQGGAPNYFPNSFSGPQEERRARQTVFNATGDVQRYNSADEDNFTQVGNFYRKVLSEDERQRLVENIAGHLKDAKEFIQDRAVANFSQADPDYGRRIAKLLDKYRKQPRKPSSTL